MRGLVLDGVCQRDDLILPRLCRRLKIPTDKLDKTKWRFHRLSPCGPPARLRGLATSVPGVRRGRYLLII